MPQALVGADLDLAADVGGHLAAKVTLELDVGLEVVAEGDELVVTAMDGRRVAQVALRPAGAEPAGSD